MNDDKLVSKGGSFRKMTFSEAWLTRRAVRYRRLQVRNFFTRQIKVVHDYLDRPRLQRLQLRWAWAKLGCRCAFDRKHHKILENAHCPIHGWSGMPPEDPEGWENVERPVFTKPSPSVTYRQ